MFEGELGVPKSEFRAALAQIKDLEEKLTKEKKDTAFCIEAWTEEVAIQKELFRKLQDDFPRWRTGDPPEDGWYLVTVEGLNGKIVTDCFWTITTWWGFEKDSVTSWMPLPRQWGGEE